MGSSRKGNIREYYQRNKTEPQAMTFVFIFVECTFIDKINQEINRSSAHFGVVIKIHENQPSFFFNYIHLQLKCWWMWVLHNLLTSANYQHEVLHY